MSLACRVKLAAREASRYEQIQFLHTCLHTYVMQISVDSRPPVNSDLGHRVAEQCGRKMVRVFITVPYVANISEAVARLLKPFAVGVAHRPAGTLRSRVMRIKDRVDPSEQSSIIYRAQSKDCSNNCTGQTPMKLATRLKEHRSAIRNCSIKASLMTAHCVNTGHDFNLAEAKILSHASSWTASLFKEAWLSNENSINNCIELPQAYSVLRAAIS